MTFSPDDFMTIDLVEEDLRPGDLVMVKWSGVEMVIERVNPYVVHARTVKRTVGENGLRVVRRTDLILLEPSARR